MADDFCGLLVCEREGLGETGRQDGGNHGVGGGGLGYKGRLDVVLGGVDDLGLLVGDLDLSHCSDWLEGEVAGEQGRKLLLGGWLLGSHGVGQEWRELEGLLAVMWSASWLFLCVG